MLRVLFSGGGSIGHVAPSLAVWEALKQKEPTARALFVCTVRSDERTFLRTNGIRFVPLITARTKSIFFPLLFPLGCLQSLLILIVFRPHVIFSKGGYASVPIALVGWLLRRPIVLHESDRVMGRANRMLLKYAKHLCIGTPQKEIANTDVMTKTTIPITATGNPIRKKLLAGTHDGGLRVTRFSGKRPMLLVIGGSQGAQAINEAVWAHLEQLVNSCDIVHIAGRGKMNKKAKHGRYIQYETLFNDLEHVLALADVVLTRAGAGAIAELSALGKAAILVPLPDLGNNHQEENAQFLRAANAVVVLDQKRMEEELVPTVTSLMHDEARRRELADRLRAFADPDAAERIANILIAHATKNR